MSNLISSDPLALIAIEAGLVKAPLADGAAAGDSKLDTQQRAAVIGEPVPVVFCKRDETAGTGGVLISPAATEARFENDTSNAVTASYHLVLSEGRIGSIQVRDVFQRSCRVGNFSQTYDRRAGTWQPGNFIVARSGFTAPQCPYYCGTIGTYDGMSTLSFQNTIPDGFDQWNRQVHCFVRNGIEVPRLIEGTVGSSNNFADLVQWALVNCAKLPAAMIDTTSLTTAARFLAANQFNCDINITSSANLADFLAKLAPYFLLAETRVNGRRGLRPLLPLTPAGAIKTTAASWAATFTEEQIIPGSLEISYVPLADRKPFCVQAIWRQQLTDDFGIIRTSEVRYPGEALDGPFEQHDLSEFCTREDHAVKVAAYIRARRKHITHTARFSVRPQTFSPPLAPGDIVRVKLQRVASGSNPSAHDYLYEINRITQTIAGDLSFEVTHFPIDANGCSLVALDVVGTTGTGIVLTSTRTGVSCDINSSTDLTIPPETFIDVPPIDTTISMPDLDVDAGFGGSGTDVLDNLGDFDLVDGVVVGDLNDVPDFPTDGLDVIPDDVPTDPTVGDTWTDTDTDITWTYNDGPDTLTDDGGTNTWTPGWVDPGTGDSWSFDPTTDTWTNLDTGEEWFKDDGDWQRSFGTEYIGNYTNDVAINIDATPTGGGTVSLGVETSLNGKTWTAVSYLNTVVPTTGLTEEVVLKAEDVKPFVRAVQTGNSGIPTTTLTVTGRGLTDGTQRSPYSFLIARIRIRMADPSNERYMQFIAAPPYSQSWRLNGEGAAVKDPSVSFNLLALALNVEILNGAPDTPTLPPEQLLANAEWIFDYSDSLNVIYDQQGNLAGWPDSRSESDFQYERSFHIDVRRLQEIAAADSSVFPVNLYGVPLYDSGSDISYAFSARVTVYGVKDTDVPDSSLSTLAVYACGLPTDPVGLVYRPTQAPNAFFAGVTKRKPLIDYTVNVPSVTQPSRFKADSGFIYRWPGWPALGGAPVYADYRTTAFTNTVRADLKKTVVGQLRFSIKNGQVIFIPRDQVLASALAPGATFTVAVGLQT